MLCIFCLWHSFVVSEACCCVFFVFGILLLSVRLVAVYLWTVFVVVVVFWFAEACCCVSFVFGILLLSVRLVAVYLLSLKICCC